MDSIDVEADFDNCEDKSAPVIPFPTGVNSIYLYPPLCDYHHNIQQLQQLQRRQQQQPVGFIPF